MIAKSSIPVGPVGKVMDFVDVGLVFETLSFAGHLYRFDAKLKSLDTAVRGASANLLSNFTYVTPQERTAASPSEGATTFTMDSRGTDLPKGTRMTWVTR
jgi:hypothetical protein